MGVPQGIPRGSPWEISPWWGDPEYRRRDSLRSARAIPGFSAFGRVPGSWGRVQCQLMAHCHVRARIGLPLPSQEHPRTLPRTLDDHPRGPLWRIPLRIPPEDPLEDHREDPQEGPGGSPQEEPPRDPLEDPPEDSLEDPQDDPP